MQNGKVCIMATVAIPAQEPTFKQRVLKLLPPAFERWASPNGYDISPAVSPTETRTYADRRTQEAFEAFSAGESNLARALTDSTFETEVMRERVYGMAGKS
jgi:hypothetical protein